MVSLFHKEAIEIVEKTLEKEIISFLFTVKKKEKDGSLRPILDLKSLKQKSDDDKKKHFKNEYIIRSNKIDSERYVIHQE